MSAQRSFLRNNHVGLECVQHPAAEAVDVNEIEVDYEPEQASQWLLSFVCAHSSIQEHGKRLRMKADA